MKFSYTWNDRVFPFLLRRLCRTRIGNTSFVCLVFGFQLISNYAEQGDLDTVGYPLKDSRGNTEYRLQFAWPKGKHNVDSVTHEDLKAAGGGSRRSAYMAATGHDRPPVPVHKKRFLDSDKREGKRNYL